MDRSDARGAVPSSAAFGRSAPVPSCHQPSNPLAANTVAFSSKMACHLPRPIPWRLQELRIDQTHQRQILRRLASRLIIIGGSADCQKLALANNRQVLVACLNHCTSPLDAHRPEVLAKKSRSTTSWPILACNFSKSPSRMPSFSSALLENIDARPSTA